MTDINRLRTLRAYLCGPMDRVPDGGIVWRKRLRDDLDGRGIVWLDPTDKPCEHGSEDLENRDIRKNAKRRGMWAFVEAEMKVIRLVDLRLVDICDFVIVHLDMDIHCCGTYFEIARANEQLKPILVHVEQGKEHAPDWLFGELPHEFIFSNWDEIEGYLSHIDNDPVVNTMNRWFFFDFDKRNSTDTIVS